MSFIRCDTCMGKKTYIGMGLLEHQCKTCHGTGYREMPDNTPKSTKSAAEQKKIPTKRARGRPRKYNLEKKDIKNEQST